MEFKNKCVPFKLTNKELSVFPPDDDIINYITACPSIKEKEGHAEYQLMDIREVQRS